MTLIRPEDRNLHKPLVALISVLLTGVFFTLVGSSIHISLTNAHDRVLINEAREQWSQLNQAEIWLAEEKYAACAGVISNLTESSVFPERVTTLSERCYTPWAQSWLKKASAEAEAGHLRKAIAAALHVKEGALKSEAEQAITEWSLQIINLAHEHYAKPTSELEESLEMLQAIPGNSPLGKESQLWADRWQSEWENNSRYERSAAAALKENDPLKARKFVEEISSHRAWTDTKDQLFISIEAAEQRNEQIAQKAEEVLASQNPEEAILLAQQLPDNSTWRDRKSAIVAQATDNKTTKGGQPAAIPIAAALAALVVLGLIRR
ncbi:MAG: hypothetical protein WA949_03245 [Phormidesmis sp.]